MLGKAEKLLAIEAPVIASVPAPVAEPAPATAPIPVPVPIPAPAKIPTPVPTPLDNLQGASNIFTATDSGKSLDVTSIITKRLNAMRKLQDNPLDSEALKLMYNTQKDVSLILRSPSDTTDTPIPHFQMSAWANSKFVPGQFTGSTGANVLTAKELSSGFQAWAKRVSNPNG